MANDLSIFLSISETARALNEAPNTTRARVARGELPAIYIGRTQGIPPSAVDRILALRAAKADGDEG